MRSGLLLALATCSAICHPAYADDPYFKRDSEGWFWYKDPPEEPEPEVAPPEPSPMPVAAPAAAAVPTPPPAPAPGPPPGSVEFLRQAMPLALDVATDDPSPQNVERYLLLQKAALDKSEKFAEVSKMVSTGHPDLDEGRRRPRQDTFAKQLEEEAEARKREVLSDLFQTNALVMFVDRNCSGCALMAENLYRMQQTHGLVWQSVSLDGTLLPEEISDSQSFDAGLSQQLGVANGGAVFIASPPDRFIPVTWNPTGGAEIADRVLLVAARAGLIDDAAFRDTQPINPRINEAGAIATGELPEILKEADAYLRPSPLVLNASEARP